MELFLAKLLGLYLIIVGAIVLVQRRSIMPTMKDLLGNKPLLFSIALIELAAGLAILLNYSVVSATVEGVIAIVGWMLVVESIFYLAMPMKMIQKFVKPFNTPSWYVGGGIIAVALGAFLAGSGFGLVAI